MLNKTCFFVIYINTCYFGHMGSVSRNLDGWHELNRCIYGHVCSRMLLCQNVSPEIMKGFFGQLVNTKHSLLYLRGT